VVCGATVAVRETTDVVIQLTVVVIQQSRLMNQHAQDAGQVPPCGADFSPRPGNEGAD